MNKFGFATIIAGGLATGFLGFAAPLDESSIVSVRYDNEDRVVYVTTR
ncbi:hypothetical protein [Mycolicibacterium litorale]|nr:hypothetical protein [Mycolicibacterium litorale]MCV7414660.1 hypothetical protein [Mycolicibacterium litorale]